MFNTPHYLIIIYKTGHSESYIKASKWQAIEHGAAQMHANIIRDYEVRTVAGGKLVFDSSAIPS